VRKEGSAHGQRRRRRRPFGRRLFRRQPRRRFLERRLEGIFGLQRLKELVELRRRQQEQRKLPGLFQRRVLGWLAQRGLFGIVRNLRLRKQ
jgi:hypothetical protein